MVDVGVFPDTVRYDDPGFDAFLDELTEFLNANPPEPVDEDLSHLAAMPTGTMAAAMLTQVDDTELSGRDRLAVLQARVRMQSHFHALVYEDMAAVADACENTVDPELGWEAASAEIRAALRLTRRSADHELDMALSLRDRVPMVLEALKAGDIDHQRAATIVRGTSHLPAELAQRAATEIVGVAGRLTTGQLKERLRRMVIDLNPKTPPIATNRRSTNDGSNSRQPTTEPATFSSSTPQLTEPPLPDATSTGSPAASAPPASSARWINSAPTSPSTSSTVSIPLRSPSRAEGPAGRSTSPSTSPPSPDSQKTREDSKDSDPSSPTSPARSQPTRHTHVGGTPSPTPTATNRSQPESPAADQPPANTAPSPPTIPPACSPAAGCRPATATSTTAQPGQNMDPPRWTTSPLSLIHI